MLRSLNFSTASPLIQRRAAQNNTAPNDAARSIPGTMRTATRPITLDRRVAGTVPEVPD